MESLQPVSSCEGRRQALALETAVNPDDEKILNYAVELFDQLGITRPEPDTVVWEDDMHPDLVVVKFGEVRLPRSNGPADS
jgi:hypothetical protein